MVSAAFWAAVHAHERVQSSVRLMEESEEEEVSELLDISTEELNREIGSESNPHGKIHHTLPYKGYKKIRRASKDLPHEVVICLRLKNARKVKHILDTKIYNENHEQHLNFLSFEEIKKLTLPKGSLAKVQKWLRSHNLTSNWVSNTGTFIKVNATVGAWEGLLGSEFWHWGNKETVHADKYYLDKSVANHIFALFNVVDTEAVLHNNRRVLTDYSSSSVTPEFLAKLYQKSVSRGSADHKQSVFSTSNEYFSYPDLKTFQKKYGLQRDVPTSIGNHHLGSEELCDTSSSSSSSKECWEGSLDVQYISSTAMSTNTVFHYVSGKSTNPFVQYLTEVAAQEDPPKVLSISWGSTEQSVSPSIMTAFCNQAMNLAARGVTIVVSSGDNGAIGTGFSSSGECSKNTCTENSGSKYWSSDSWSGSGLFPSFPATCPWVLAVGGTMGPESGQDEVAYQSNVCLSSRNRGGVITSGGGFSTFFERPTWQDSSVANYLQSSAMKPSGGYNRDGRGYPDVSAIAVRYSVVIANDFYSIYGTSASAPVIAGMITLVNGLRAAQNRSSIGWINRALYDASNNKSSSIFNDIVRGSNNCCSSTQCQSDSLICCEGFESISGWDPVTGLGSLNFPSQASTFSVKAPEYPESSGWRSNIPLSDLELYTLLA